MASFTDSTGRRWSVRVSLGSLRELEEAAGFPVLEAIADRERLRREILGRAEVLAKGLYFALGDEARREVAYEEFERRVAGPAVGEAARAYFEALAECFPQRQAKDEDADEDDDEDDDEDEDEDERKTRPTEAGPGPGARSTGWRRLREFFNPGRIRSAS